MKKQLTSQSDSDIIQLRREKEQLERRGRDGKGNYSSAKTSKGITGSFTCYAGVNDCNNYFSWVSVSSVDLELSVLSSTGAHVS